MFGISHIPYIHLHISFNEGTEKKQRKMKRRFTKKIPIYIELEVDFEVWERDQTNDMPAEHDVEFKYNEERMIELVNEEIRNSTYDL